MGRRGKCGCSIVVTDSIGGTEGEFDLSGNGYRSAVEIAGRRSESRHKKHGPISTFVDLKCDDGKLPLLYCNYGTCSPSLKAAIKDMPNPIAGLNALGRRKGSKKRKKARDKKKRSGPLTPQQKKFKAAASACSGKPGYRECVADHLRK